ncbi:triphosphatase [Gammaproteobacteria bacterium]
MATEIELKFSMTADAQRRVASLSVVRNHAQGRGKRIHLINTYYDTQDRFLATKGMALRIRRQGSRWIQTVKTAGVIHTGMHKRGEWEWDIPNQNINFNLCTTEPEIAEAFVDPQLQATLEPLFTTDFWRTAWTLVFPDNSHIELAVDHGEIRAAGQSVPICELELELKEGSHQCLYEVAAVLAEAMQLRLEDTSKAARGYSLLMPPTAPTPRKPTPIALHREKTVEEAFQAILQHGLEHLHANSSVVIHGEDPEGIHQMRVATRRLRSCLNLFRPLVPLTASDGINTEIAWLTGELGLARDWDVFINETLHPLIRHFPGDAALATFVTTATVARSQAYATARAAVNSSRYTQLLLKTNLWHGRRDWRDLVTTEQLKNLERPIMWFAADLLAQRDTRVRKWGGNFSQLSAEKRHHLRILCKRLRYAGEFFANLYRNSQARDYLRSVAKLQDVLGVMNDAVVARKLIDALDIAPDNPAIHLVLGWTAAMIEQCHGNFMAAWAAFCDQSRFWE